MIGYPGLNRTLRDRDPPVRCTRGMQKQTFEERGLSYVSTLAQQNLTDLYELLTWNLEHEIRTYRCTSSLIPWNSQFKLSELPEYEEIRRLARRCGNLIKETDMRLTFHPDYWCKPASDSADTRDRARTALEYHADWFDLLGLPVTLYYGITVHIGATYGDVEATAERFHAFVDSLSDAARARLTVENDDKETLWSVSELVELISEPTDVPVVFDYHHHSFADRGYTYREAFELAAETWGDVRPMAHYSEPACLRDPAVRPQAHAEFVVDLPAWLVANSDVVIEADGKEQAVLRLRDDA
ncbi:UV DNA damage repair endonuclease UvsE [Halorubrum sp. ASP1]|uniref:UV DNA damage repair endonuclease UvsE n=1 Tax=Halorubrum sp. ASP1 TaxID=2518114 RepID=UPI0010F7B506|nr:UV DNA damage repair endonuclease UvsE [Halorubrum sp. ASP1]TKX59795.1 UV DNA damage repair endonuclease UvsE [Halorubrum sp. ASP1]